MKIQNRGALRLMDTGETREEIAAKLNVTTTIVTYWISGERKPGTANREKLAAAYRIPVEAWDDNGPVEAKPQKTSVNTSVVTDDDVASCEPVARLKAQLKRLDAMRQEAGASVLMSVKLTHLETRAIQLLAQYTGEGCTISESRIIRLPVFQNMIEKLLDAIAPWPDALEAVSKTMSDDDS